MISMCGRSTSIYSTFCLVSLSWMIDPMLWPIEKLQIYCTLLTIPLNETNTRINDEMMRCKSEKKKKNVCVRSADSDAGL